MRRPARTARCPVRAAASGRGCRARPRSRRPRRAASGRRVGRPPAPGSPNPSSSTSSSAARNRCSPWGSARTAFCHAMGATTSSAPATQADGGAPGDLDDGDRDERAGARDQDGRQQVGPQGRVAERLEQHRRQPQQQHVAGIAGGMRDAQDRTEGLELAGVPEPEAGHQGAHVEQHRTRRTRAPPARASGPAGVTGEPIPGPRPRSWLTTPAPRPSRPPTG